MRKNTDKWNHFIELINKREAVFVENKCANVPSELYRVYPSGTIQMLNITTKSYRNGLYFHKKPTNQDVADIISYWENDEPMNSDNIRIHYEENHNYGKSSGAIKLDDLKHYFTKEEANLKSLEVLEIKKKEQILLDNGHFRCARCSKVELDSKKVIGKIIFRNSRQDPTSRSGYKQFVDSKTLGFCSGTCASHEQMAHEG